jgi:hypothetical protein
MKKKLFSNYLLLTWATCAMVPLDLNASESTKPSSADVRFDAVDRSPILSKIKPPNPLKSLEALENEIGKLIDEVGELVEDKGSVVDISLPEDTKLQLRYVSCLLKNIGQHRKHVIFSETKYDFHDIDSLLDNQEKGLLVSSSTNSVILKNMYTELNKIFEKFQENETAVGKYGKAIKLMEICKEMKNELGSLLKIFASDINADKNFLFDISKNVGAIPAAYLALELVKSGRGGIYGLSKELKSIFKNELKQSYARDESGKLKSVYENFSEAVYSVPDTASSDPSIVVSPSVPSGGTRIADNVISYFFSDKFSSFPSPIKSSEEASIIIEVCKDYKTEDTQLIKAVKCYLAGYIEGARIWNDDQMAKSNEIADKLGNKEIFSSKLKEIISDYPSSDFLRKLVDPLLESLECYKDSFDHESGNFFKEAKGLLDFVYNLERILSKKVKIKIFSDSRLDFKKIFEDLNENLKKFKNSKEKLYQLKAEVDPSRFQEIETQLKEAKNEQDFSNFIESIDNLELEINLKKKALNDIKNLENQVAQLRQNPKASLAKAQLDALVQDLAAKRNVLNLNGAKDLVAIRNVEGEIKNIGVRLTQLNSDIAMLPTTPVVPLTPIAPLTRVVPTTILTTPTISTPSNTSIKKKKNKNKKGRKNRARRKNRSRRKTKIKTSKTKTRRYSGLRRKFGRRGYRYAKRNRNRRIQKS